MSQLHNTKNVIDHNKSDSILIYFLICLTALSSLISIKSQTFGTYFYWGILGILFAFNILRNSNWQGFLVLTTALATLSVFQAGVIIGYRIWYYITIIAVVFLSFRFKLGYFSMPGFKWWFFLLLLGIFDLGFAQSDDAFQYSRGALVQITAGLSAFAIGYQISRLREYRDAIAQLSFLIMAVCTISLLVPVYTTIDESLRLGEGLGMDANGVGTTGIYAFVAMLLFVLDEKRKLKAPIIVFVICFLTVVFIKTGSRGTIICAVLTLGLFLIMTFRRKVKMNQLIIIICILLGFSYLVRSTQTSYVEERFAKSFGTGVKVDRLDHLIISLYMVADHPFGLGGGGFKDNFSVYANKAGIGSVSIRPSPHTLFGMVIADWGIPGILLLLAGFVALGRGIMKSTGLSRTVKALALFTYLILANAGMSFPPIFLSLLGLTDQGKMHEGEEELDAKRGQRTP